LKYSKVRRHEAHCVVLPTDLQLIFNGNGNASSFVEVCLARESTVLLPHGSFLRKILCLSRSTMPVPLGSLLSKDTKQQPR
jgi:hypothetical protein